MIGFEAGVRIARPVEEVFAFVSDPLKFPLWNSAVQDVRRISGDASEAGSMYSMQRELATGRVVNELEVFARDHPDEFGIRTTSGPTPFTYRYRFAFEGGSTAIRLSARVQLPGVAGALGPLVARGVRRGVDANFTTLQQILEGPAQQNAHAAGMDR